MHKVDPAIFFSLAFDLEIPLLIIILFYLIIRTQFHEYLEPEALRAVRSSVSLAHRRTLICPALPPLFSLKPLVSYQIAIL